MSPNNLAIIFAPCLLQSKEKKNPEEILKDLPKQTEYVLYYLLAVVFLQGMMRGHNVSVVSDYALIVLM